MRHTLSCRPHFTYTQLVVTIVACISLPVYANSIDPVPQISNNDLPDSTIDKDSQSTAEFERVAATEHVNVVEDNAEEKTYQPSKGQRYGEWKIVEVERTNTDLYDDALEWHAHSEIEPQQAKQALLSQQLESFIVNSQNTNLSPLLQWVKTLPATGRVNLPEQEPRYVQVHQNIEPVFGKGDTVTVHTRPTTLTVLFDDATGCHVTYEAGVRIQDYINTCQLNMNNKDTFDDAYLILPDGRVEVVTLAKWNAQAQDTPAPGAWIWVPNPKHQWPKELATQMAHFIATQGIGVSLPYEQTALPIPLNNPVVEQSRDLPISASDWGIIGLMQTPTARMSVPSTLTTHISHVSPYTQYNLVLQPFDRLETAVRYSNINGVSYGPVSPKQDLKDKSLDVKLKVINESQWIPQLAVGWRDLAGTSLFGGEYVVANKRYGDFDFSLGMGWGYLGARGNVENPLKLVGDRFEKRVADKQGQGGELSPKSWFTGPASLFGGVQWHTPYDPLTVKIEYDGNDYESEPHSNPNFNEDSFPVNVGVTWQDAQRGIAVSTGLERGDTLMFGLSLQGDLSKVGQTKPKAPPVQPASVPQPNDSKFANISYSSLNVKMDLAEGDTNLSKNAEILTAFSKATGWRATDLTIDQGNVLLNVDGFEGVFINERLQQGMQVLRSVLPADTKFIQIQVLKYGEAVAVFNIDPTTWAQQYFQLPPPSQRIEQPVTVTSAASAFNSPTAQVAAYQESPRGAITFSPSLKQSIGGPDGYLYGIFANANVNYKLWQGAWINADAQVRLVDNYDNFTYTAKSKLPRVRTNIGQYMTTSRILMPNLQVNQFKALGDNWYGLAYAGYLESMFAGVGAEVMYRPPHQSWAVGLDVNQVRKRDFDQHFGLQDYDVTTGHMTLYWDTPLYDIDMKLSAGQYLAGDKGVTLDLSRGFANGVKMGGWLTKTDVSAEDFGEGSMDKGVYVSIPFDALFKQWSSGVSNIVYRPLIRDGGAKLNQNSSLYDLTSPLDESLLTIRNPMYFYNSED